MRTLIIKTENENQLDLLLQLATELHMKVEMSDDEASEKIAIQKLAETSFAKDWNSEEDEVWTEFLKNKKYVSTL